MQYTTCLFTNKLFSMLFYQDFKDTFVCNTQHSRALPLNVFVVLSGFQRYICMQYTTPRVEDIGIAWLFYQDFKDTFVCNTQRFHLHHLMLLGCFIRISKIHLYAIHNRVMLHHLIIMLFYQDFKDTFVCNTQLVKLHLISKSSCFIRISKIHLYAIHNY